MQRENGRVHTNGTDHDLDGTCHGWPSCVRSARLFWLATGLVLVPLVVLAAHYLSAGKFYAGGDTAGIRLTHTRHWSSPRAARLVVKEQTGITPVPPCSMRWLCPTD